MTKKQRQLILEETSHLNNEELTHEALEKICEFFKANKEQEKLLHEIIDLYVEIAKKRGIDIFE